MTVSIIGDYFTPWMDQMFVVGIVAMVVIGLGGIPLGIVMLRNGFRPWITPVLLIGFLPLLFAITTVTSLGSALLPLMWGWALAVRGAARSADVVSPAPARSRGLQASGHSQPAHRPGA
jgi:hypothetical protein